MNSTLQTLYTNPSLPGSFAGLENFYHALRQAGHKFKKKDVQKFLRDKDAYTLHYPRRIKFPRNKVIVPGIDDTWQIDLADMTNISKDNGKIKYILVCIDVFSKFLSMEPTEDKTGKAIVEALNAIFERTERMPKQIQSDDGTEFKNRVVQKFLEDNEINFYTTKSDLKACVVERVIRTMKERMYRYFTEKSTHKYVDVLQKLVDAYNNSKHRTLGITPNQVTEKNEARLWRKMFKYKPPDKCDFKFNIGDSVRLSSPKEVFDKGYEQKWTDEVFIISERIARSPAIYKIKDLNHEDIDGFFYEHEMQKVIKLDDVYKVEKVIKNRTLNGVKESFVKWRGYPESFNSWVRSEDIENLQ
jgi:hypothetical protein